MYWSDQLKRVSVVFIALVVIGGLGITTACSASESTSGEKTSEEQEQTSVLDEAMLGLKVRAAILSQVGTDALGIDVEVEGSHALLGGEVETEASQELAGEAALSVEGIGDITNSIQVAEQPTTPEEAKDEIKREISDAQLETRVKLRLLEEIGMNAMDIEVEAVSGIVSLRGKVEDDNTKERALSTAESVEGVEDVRDLMS